MSIDAFPAALQPIIQQNFLEHEFREGLRSVLAYRGAAKKEPIANNIGETVTKTRAGLKAPVTSPLTPSSNTNLDNGLSPSTWTVEQFTLTLNMYGDTIDLNTVTQKVGIVKQFMHNARVNGVQSAQSLDRVARNKLFAAYLGGNTRVITTLGSPSATVHVDDITGFSTVLVNGVVTAVSSGNPLAVTIGADSYNVIGTTADGSNVSTAFNGVSGTLTLSANCTVADGTAGNAAVSNFAPTILRGGAATTLAGIPSNGAFTMSMALDAVAYLRRNAVPAINGFYNVHLDPVSSRQLFADADFKQLFTGQDGASEFRMGRVIELLDCRFIPTTEAPVIAHPTISGAFIRHPIVLGDEALIEGTFDGELNDDVAPAGAIIDVVDDIVQTTRPPLDRLGQIIAQSWYWIGDFCAPTDQTTNTAIVPTASASYFKRGVALQTIG